MKEEEEENKKKEEVKKKEKGEEYRIDIIDQPSDSCLCIQHFKLCCFFFSYLIKFLTNVMRGCTGSF